MTRIDDASDYYRHAKRVSGHAVVGDCHGVRLLDMTARDGALFEIEAFLAGTARPLTMLAIFGTLP